MSILSSGKTDAGLVRGNNEDSFLINKEINLFVVADGMGGHLGGEVASKMAVNAINDFVKENLKKAKNPKDLMEEAIKHANQTIFNHAKANEKIHGMGTTVVALLLKDSFAYIGSVGDSRCYLINKGLIYQLNRDHTLVQEKINLGIYSREQANKDTMKNVLIRTVGYDQALAVDVLHYKVLKNDLFLLCSDGLHGPLHDHDINYLINQRMKSPETSTQEDLENSVVDLINQANQNGGNDNITSILVVAK